MPAVARELSIVYGSATLGGASENLLVEKYRENIGYESGTIEADVIVTGTTESTFITNCTALESAFRTPRQRLRVILGSQTQIDWNPADSTNTGFNQQPTIAKVGDPADTGRSRRYHITVTAELPADLSGQAGRRLSSTTIAYGPNRQRQVTFAGQYTALTSLLARAQYEAQVATFTSTVLTGIDATAAWEKISEQVENDDTNKNATFSVIFEELLYNQSSGTLDDPAIVGLRVNFNRSIPSPGDSVLNGVSVNRLEIVAVAFSCVLDKGQSTDPKAVYESTLRPHLVSEIQAKFSPSFMAIIDDQHHFNFPQNALSGTLLVQMTTGGPVVEFTRIVEVRSLTPSRFVDVWDGNPYSAQEYKTHGQIFRTVTDIGILIEGAPQVYNLGPAKFDALGTRTGNWHPIEGARTETVTVIGDSEHSFRLLRFTVGDVHRWIEPPSGVPASVNQPAGGPGAGGAGRRPT